LRTKRATQSNSSNSQHEPSRARRLSCASAASGGQAPGTKRRHDRQRSASTTQEPKPRGLSHGERLARTRLPTRLSRSGCDVGLERGLVLASCPVSRLWRAELAAASTRPPLDAERPFLDSS
jgi:hypothetical protein